jgi:tetratricopeptide (TPR) repeat protein
MSLWTWVNADEDASAARFGSLLVLDPDRASYGYENLARYWREKGDWDRAVRVLGTALAQQRHARLFTERGIGFSALGMPDSGLVAFQKAIAADSTNADGYFGCGQMLWLLSRSEEALPYLRKAVAMEPTRVQYRYQLGEVLRATGDYQAALPHLEYASEKVTAQPASANMYAVTLFDAGEADSAITVLRTLINRHPTFALAYSNLAWIQYQQGDIPGAEAALSEYERQTRPENLMATAVILRQTIDSVRAAGSTGAE